MRSLLAKLGFLAATAAVGSIMVVGTASTAGAATRVAPCSSNHLTVHHTATDGAAGHGSFVLVFRNIGSHSCTLTGYPRVHALSERGHLMARAAHTLSGYSGGAQAVQTVVIHPGHAASAVVEYLFYNPVTLGNCLYSADISVWAPHRTHRFVQPVSVSVCDLQVHPVVAGTSGRN
jgi:hypothetical protein